MRKLSILLTTVILASSLGTAAFAGTNEDANVKNAGITPDSILYPIDVALDNLKIALTNGTVKKAQLELKIADERLSESIVMKIKNNPKLAVEAVKKYNINLTNAENTLQAQLSDIKDTTDEKTAELQKEVTDAQDKGTDVLKNIEDNIPEESKQEITNVIQMQTAKKEAVHSMIEAIHKLNDARKDFNNAETLLRKVEKSGDSQALEAAKTALAETQTNYDEAKKAYVTAFADKQTAFKNANSAKKSIIKPSDGTVPAAPPAGTTTPSATQIANTTTNDEQKGNSAAAKASKSQNNNSDNAKLNNSDTHKKKK